MTTTNVQRKESEQKPKMIEHLGMQLTEVEHKAVMKGHMVPMKSLRTITISNTSGHAKRIEANAPTLMPRALVKDAMEKGCVPLEQSDVKLVEALDRTKHDFGPGLRKAIIFMAMNEIFQDNNPDQFTGAGQPKQEVINDMVGFDVAKKEMQTYWQELNTLKKSDGDLPDHPNAGDVYKVLKAEDRSELVTVAVELGYEKEKVEGLVNKDLRHMLLKALSN